RITIEGGCIRQCYNAMSTSSKPFRLIIALQEAQIGQQSKIEDAFAMAANAISCHAKLWMISVFRRLSESS
ncbi:hypothetical protein Tco_0600111, partial [Tanacetum coccineum]